MAIGTFDECCALKCYRVRDERGAQDGVVLPEEGTGQVSVSSSVT
jgi:hypothetical protein